MHAYNHRYRTLNKLLHYNNYIRQVSFCALHVCTCTPYIVFLRNRYKYVQSARAGLKIIRLICTERYYFTSNAYGSSSVCFHLIRKRSKLNSLHSSSRMLSSRTQTITCTFISHLRSPKQNNNTPESSVEHLRLRFKRA
jgi:hypothetical protein